MRRHGDMVRADGGSASNEIIVTGGHVGTHVDALSHVSQDGCCTAAIDAEAAQPAGGSASTASSTSRRMSPAACCSTSPRARGVDALARRLRRHRRRPGRGRRPRRRRSPVAGDVALVRTGWARQLDDAGAYLGHDSRRPRC